MQLSILNPRRILPSLPSGAPDTRPSACYYGVYLRKHSEDQPGPAEEMMLTQGGLVTGAEFLNPSDGKRLVWDPSQPLTDPNSRNGVGPFPWVVSVDPIKHWLRHPAGVWVPNNIDYWPHQGSNVAIWNHMTPPWMQGVGAEEFLRKYPSNYADATAIGDWYWDEYDLLYRCWFILTIRGNGMLCSATSPDAHGHWKMETDWNPSISVFNNDDVLSAKAARRNAVAWFGQFNSDDPNEPNLPLGLERGITSAAVLPGVPGKRKYTQIIIHTGHPSNHVLMRIDMESSKVNAQRTREVLTAWTGAGAHHEVWTPIMTGLLPTNTPDFFDMPMIDQVCETPAYLRDQGEFMAVSANGGESIFLRFSGRGLYDWPVELQMEVKGARGMVPKWIRPRWDGELWHFATSDTGLAAGGKPSGVQADPKNEFPGSVMVEADCGVVA